MRPANLSVAANITSDMSQYFLRDPGLNAIDGCAFHYSVYRSLTSFLGMDGNLQDAFDLSPDFVTAWNEMFVDNDFLNANTGELDPRHMFGTSNFDVFRWPSLSNGTYRGALGTFVTSMLMPGLVMVSVFYRSNTVRVNPLFQYYYGEEQNFYVYDSTANNYLYG